MSNKADCDCEHTYLDHQMRVRDGVLCGGLDCKVCDCKQFDNDLVRLLAANKAAKSASEPRGET